jgi:hypothetical protein
MGTEFPTSDDPADNKNVNSNFWHLKITGSTEKLKTILEIIILKAELVKNLNPVTRYFQLVIDKDLDNQSDHWHIADETHERNGHLTIRLSEVDFGGNLDASKIIIDNVNYENDGIKTLGDYSNEKQALLDLERTLTNLRTKYRGVEDIKTEPEFDLVEPTELGKPNIEGDINPARNREATGLQAYVHGQVNTTKNILYNLTDEIKNEIDY